MRAQPHRETRRLEPADARGAGQTAAGSYGRRLERGAPLDASVLLELQRTAGNRSVAQLLGGLRDRDTGGVSLQRIPKPAPKPTPKVPAAPTVKAKWTGEVGENAGPSMVGEIQRIPIEGLPSGRALVLVPISLGKAPAAVEVLIHLHGFGIGYRKLTRSLIEQSKLKGSTVRTAGMKEGEVRDKALDQTEAQLQASGRPMVAILPQARGLHSEFGVFTSDSYIHQVFEALVKLGIWTRGKSPDGLPVVGGTVLSGHSGAGGTLGPMLGKPSRLPRHLEEVILFDAINSQDQLNAVERWVQRELTKDLHSLMAAPTKVERTAYLANSMRFRGYYTQNARYPKRYQALDKTIKDWFTNHATALEILGAKDSLTANYKVIPSEEPDHEKVMGSQERFKESLGVLGPALASGSAPKHTAADETAAAATGTKLTDAFSGKHWVSKFPGSKTTDTLKTGFKEHVDDFIALLEANGADIKISATYRPKERAFLMNRAGKIMIGKLKPADADDPLHTGIVWDHGDDAKSRAAAAAMCAPDGYDIAYPAAYPSRHMIGLAIDMSIKGLPETITGLPDGKEVNIGSAPAESNAKLWKIGEHYYHVIKKPDDRPHWSDNGH